jgi:hypothetical protein
VLIGAGGYYYLIHLPDHGAGIEIRAINIIMRSVPLPAALQDDLRERRDRSFADISGAVRAKEISLSEFVGLAVDTAVTDADSTLSRAQKDYLAERRLMLDLFAAEIDARTAAGELRDSAGHPLVYARGVKVIEALSRNADRDLAAGQPFGTHFLETEILGAISAAQRSARTQPTDSESDLVLTMLLRDPAIASDVGNTQLVALKAALTFAFADRSLGPPVLAALSALRSHVDQQLAWTNRHGPRGRQNKKSSNTFTPAGPGAESDFASMPECPPDPRCPPEE